jgi:DNA-binding NarL/FixJ family response regulator
MEPLFATGNAIAQKKKHPDDVRIAIVEDDPMFRHALEYHLEKIPGNRVFTFDSGEEYLKQYHQLDPQILIIDYRLTETNPGGMNGLQVLDNIKSSHHSTEVIFLSGQENLEVAASAIKKGASEYIRKDEKAP